MFAIILIKMLPRVTATLGWEQEYFVIDEAMFNARPDLVMSGRTVFGHTSCQRTSNWKIIILVPFRKECMPTCGIMKQNLTNWVFLYEHAIMKWRPRNLSVRLFLKK